MKYDDKFDKEIQEIKRIEKDNSTDIMYARKCDYTDKGMNQGYVFVDKGYDNSCYLTEQELEVLANKVANALNNSETDEELCDIAYAVDYYYWTEWEDEFEWKEVNGVLTEIE